jgi:hypothetical protein
MAAVTDPASDPRAPGERRLARPPSDRYRPAAAADVGSANTAAAGTGRDGSPARGVAFGAIAALGGAAATVVLGGVLAISAGLVVVAAATGYGVGLAVTAGTGTLSGADRRPARPWIAAVLAILGVVLGQLGLWLFARAEGGVLALPDYLGQTFGPVVPLQWLLAGVVAWWKGR